jgi:uncharacterized membrane protein
MGRLPETMSLYEVERRVARLRWRLLVTACTLSVVGSCCFPVAAWTFNPHWLALGAAYWVMAAVPTLAYLVIKTPEMVPRMAEHYRTRGVRIDHGGQP